MSLPTAQFSDISPSTLGMRRAERNSISGRRPGLCCAGSCAGCPGRTNRSREKTRIADDAPVSLRPLAVTPRLSATRSRYLSVLNQPRFVCGSSTVWPALALIHSYLLFYSELGFTPFMDKLLLGLTSHLAMQETLLLFFLKRCCYWPHFLTLPGSGVQVLLG